MARNFNGSSEYLWISNASSLDSLPMTIACRLNPDTLSPAGAGLLVDVSPIETSAGADSQGLFFFGATAGDPLACQSQDAGVGTGTAQTGSSGFSAGAWYAALASFISTTSRAVYGTGGLSGTNTTSVNPTVTGGIHVGKRAEGLFFDGSLADVCGWTVELSEAERASYVAGFPGRRIRPQSLSFYMPLVRSIVRWKGVGTITDFSGAHADHPRIYGW